MRTDCTLSSISCNNSQYCRVHIKVTKSDINFKHVSKTEWIKKNASRKKIIKVTSDWNADDYAEGGNRAKLSIWEWAPLLKKEVWCGVGLQWWSLVRWMSECCHCGPFHYHCKSFRPVINECDSITNIHILFEIVWISSRWLDEDFG